jgi:uncharacterized protein (TIGR02246 family)
MHVLPRLRRERPQRRLPELRRQLRDASDSPGGEAVEGPGLDRSQTQAGRLRESPRPRRISQESVMSDDVRAIRNLIDRWMKASKAGDTKAVLDMMTDDVIFMTCGRDPFGKEEFAAASANMSDMKIDGTADVKEVTVAGDWAWARTRLSINVTMPDGKEVRRSGYTLTILFKDMDSIWRIARDANLLRVEPPPVS